MFMPRASVTKSHRRVSGAPRLKPGIVATADYVERLARFDQKTLAIWAADCAGRVLEYFEMLHPKDSRPRRAIEAARAWAGGKITMMMARKAAIATHAAARQTNDPAAVAAARAAGHAAATAHSIRHARGAPAYAIVAVIAAAAADERESATAAERKWQLAKLRSSARNRISNGQERLRA
jgi:hypothetical protein